MNSLFLITSKNNSDQLNKMIEVMCEGASVVTINDCKSIPELTNKKIVFALELNSIGECRDVSDIMSCLFDRGVASLFRSTAVVLVHSRNDLYTKSASRKIIFLSNLLGCSFIGHPVIEALGNLSNFLTWQKTLNMPLEEICLELCSRLSKRFLAEVPVLFDSPKIIALHASPRSTSNTLTLWHMSKTFLRGCSIEELNVENGTIQDCTGCSFKTCLHYSKQNSCFYGGIMVKEIMPAIEKSDAVVFICPNYNDAVSANLTAVINRTTALYRKISFYDKYLFSVIVSGNSGSDSVAQQLIGALNINKGFRLPPYFSIMKIANDPGAIEELPNIRDDAQSFAQNILSQIKKSR